MEEEKKTAEATEKVRREKSGTNTVVLVQTAVCTFMIILTVLTGKLCPSAFELLKDEYNKIMSVDMSAQELVHSAASVVENAVSVQASAAETEKKEESDDEAVAVMAKVGSTDEITVPLHGRISSEYGYRTNPISGAYAFHTGVDISADEGDVISAAYNGVVYDTGVGVKSGKYIRLLHDDGTQTLYCHCSEILADEGSYVYAGEAIALVGSTGWATGPHLHFEIKQDGKTIDPLTVLPDKNGSV